ncbi:MAG: response regulator [Acidobacteriia bacterium]|nr:response regulator [Terriglobia bacterium]
MRILIIDDDRTDRAIYRQSLGMSPGHRFEFEESDSGAAGIESAEAWRPDCILLDYNLPDMDGLEVVNRLKRPPARHPFPVVMLTAYGGEALAVQAMKAGVMDYLPKRQAAGEWLCRAVENAIEKFRMQRQIEDQRAALERSVRRYQVLLEAMPQMVWTADSQGSIAYANRRWLDYTGFSPGGESKLGWDGLVHPEDLDKTSGAWKQAVESGSVFEIEHRLRRASDGEYRWHLVRAVALRDDGRAPQWLGTCTEIEDQKRSEILDLQKQKLESIGRLAGGIAHDFNNLLVVILGGTSFASDAVAPNHPIQPMLRRVVNAGERAAQLTRQILAYAGKSNLFIERIDVSQLVRQTCEAVRSSLPSGIQLELEIGRDLPAVETDLAQMRQVITDLLQNAVEALDGKPGVIQVSAEVVEIDSEAERRGGFGTPALAAGQYVGVEVRDTGCGMDEETQKRMFDPFFTTKAVGRGLGLAGVQGFVRSNRGAIQVNSAAGSGTHFRMLLPTAVTRAPRNSVQ